MIAFKQIRAFILFAVISLLFWGAATKLMGSSTAPADFRILNELNEHIISIKDKVQANDTGIAIELDAFDGNGVYPHITLAQCSRFDTGGYFLPQPPEIALATLTTSGTVLVEAEQLCNRSVPGAYKYHMFRRQLPRFTLAIGINAIDDVTYNGEDEGISAYAGPLRLNGAMPVTGYRQRVMQRTSWHRYQAVWRPEELRQHIAAVRSGQISFQRQPARRVLIRYNIGRYLHDTATKVQAGVFSPLLLREGREKSDILYWEMHEGQNTRKRRDSKLNVYFGRSRHSWIPYSTVTEIGMSRKVLSWYLYAFRVLRADYIAKSDEDMFLRIPAILHDLDVQYTPRLRREAFYYGACDKDGNASEVPTTVLSNQTFYAGAFGSIIITSHNEFLPYFTGVFYALSYNLAGLLIADTALYSRAGPIEAEMLIRNKSDKRFKIKRNRSEYEHYGFNAEDAMISQSLAAAGMGLRDMPAWFFAGVCPHEPNVTGVPPRTNWSDIPVLVRESPNSLLRDGVLLRGIGMPHVGLVKRYKQINYDRQIEAVHKLYYKNFAVIMRKYSEKAPLGTFNYVYKRAKSISDEVGHVLQKEP